MTASTKVQGQGSYHNIRCPTASNIRVDSRRKTNLIDQNGFTLEGYANSPGKDDYVNLKKSVGREHEEKKRFNIYRRQNKGLNDGLEMESEGERHFKNEPRFLVPVT